MTAGRVQRRRTNRKRSDPSVVRVHWTDQQGSLHCATAYLSDVTEGGVGIALMTPLEIGSRVVIRGKLGENQADVELQAEVKWSVQGTGRVFQVGLELV